MKRLLCTLLLATSMGLASCLEKSTNSTELNSKFQSAGYNTKVMNAAETKAHFQEAIAFVVDVVDSLQATKGESNPEFFLAFFFNNIDDASKFVNENIAIMTRTAERYSDDPKVGSYNNVAYLGSPAAFTVAGF